MKIKEIILFCTISGFQGKSNINPKLASFYRDTSKYLRNILVGASLFPALLLHQDGAIAAEFRNGAMADVGIGQYRVKDGRQILRISQPSGKSMSLGPKSVNDPGRVAQDALELIRLRLEQVGFSYSGVWQQVGKDFSVANNVINANKNKLLEGVSSDSDASRLLNEKIIPNMQKLSDAIRAQDISLTSLYQEETGKLLSTLRQLQYPPRILPYRIPAEYDYLPRLLGRAVVQMDIESKSGYLLPNQKQRIPRISLLLEVDGYHAPLTSGNFIDLVDKKFYDNMLLKSEELIVQTQSPDGVYKDSAAGGKVRRIPLEIFYKDDVEPTYGITSDDDSRALDTQALPFQAFGALGMARNNEDVDSGSSDFFFLKWNQALVAPGRNTLDGYYSCFGYVVQNEDLLKLVQSDDKIVSARVVSGLENLVRP